MFWRKGETEDLASTGSPPRGTQQPALGQAEASSLHLHLDLLCGRQGPRTEASWQGRGSEVESAAGTGTVDRKANPLPQS